MYNTFECHFKPNQKSQSDMTDPVALISIKQHFETKAQLRGNNSNSLKGITS